jgi:hypothetical protein
MAAPGATQPLVATFAFGISVHAASATVAIYTKSYGSSIIRDGRALSLTIFLVSAALWALVDFIATTIAPTATSACQIGVVISTIFDQLARVSIEQGLVWASQSKEESKSWYWLPQILVFCRFILGAVFVGLTRPEFKPTCVAVSRQLPAAIAVLILDATILSVLAVRTSAQGKKDGLGEQETARRKALFLTLAGVAIWVATSIPMLLGVSSLDLLLRTALPAVGLNLLIGLYLLPVGP